MFLRSETRKKDGKEHRYWSVVENRRVADGRVVQRHVLYLGEINDSQRASWTKVIEVFDPVRQQTQELALYPDSRPIPDHARAYGGCWPGRRWPPGPTGCLSRPTRRRKRP